MNFQAYIDNIKAKTGKTPSDFHAEAKKAGLLGDSYKASALVAWLKTGFGLAQGHAMAIVKSFKDNGWIDAKPAGAKKVPSPTRSARRG